MLVDNLNISSITIFMDTDYDIIVEVMWIYNSKRTYKIENKRL